MLLHYRIVPEINSRLKTLTGISKILLFGSVAKKLATSSSDIDLAIILHDETRAIYLFLESEDGLPIELITKANRIKTEIELQYQIPLHLNFYYETEYDAGIRFTTDKTLPTLNQEAITLYDYDKI